jgi:hypothetical protein
VLMVEFITDAPRRSRRCEGEPSALVTKTEQQAGTTPRTMTGNRERHLSAECRTPRSNWVDEKLDRQRGSTVTRTEKVMFLPRSPSTFADFVNCRAQRQASSRHYSGATDPSVLPQ